MTTYREPSAYATTGNPLCDKLRREFRGRGAAAVRHTEPASVMMQRIQRGLDPYENAPQVQVQVQVQVQPQRPLHTPAAAPQRAARPNGRPAAGYAARTASSRPGTAAAARKAVPASSQRTSDSQRAASVEVRRKRSAAAAAARAREKAAGEEIRLTRAPFPMAAVSLLAIFTVMVLVIVFSFAQNFELTKEISSLQEQSRALTQAEKTLSLQLDERDDIRLIEDIAVNKIGMVKNNLVESRFVSVSGGDRVELAQQPETTDQEAGSGFFSTMLSAIGENLDKLREYID